LRRDTPKRRPPGLPLGADRARFGRFGTSNQHRPLPQGGGPFHAVIKLCRDQHTAGYLLPAPINTHCRTVAGEPLPVHRGGLLVRHGIVTRRAETAKLARGAKRVESARPDTAEARKVVLVRISSLWDKSIRERSE
jgi:hypothetical protein